VYDGTPWNSWYGSAYHIGDGLRSVKYNYLMSATAGLVHGNNWITYTDKITRVTSTQQGHVDWRHGGKQDTANVLFLDGHAESRKLNGARTVGDLTVKEFCTNRPG
jgi:prepilin-type processing-associated H-X9-DG protein